MSQWLKDGEVLVGQGSGEMSPRPRGVTARNPRPRRSHGRLASPSAREAAPGSPQAEMMDKARELFVLCDKDGKGFITKRDMQVSSEFGRTTKCRLFVESFTLYLIRPLILVRHYKQSYRCPLSSWTPSLRVLIGRVMDSSPLLSSTRDLVSVCLGCD